MLNQHNTGLLIIDVQGKLARCVHDSESLIENIKALIEGCKILELPIIWLEQNPLRLGDTVSELKALLNDYQPTAKHTFNACHDDVVLSAIKESGVQQWLVCGIEAHICVYQTTMDLIASGYSVEVVTDCVSSRTKTNLDLSLQKLQLNGVGMTSVEMCLFELIGDSRKDVFKQILPLIK